MVAGNAVFFPAGSILHNNNTDDFKSWASVCFCLFVCFLKILYKGRSPFYALDVSVNSFKFLSFSMNTSNISNY